MCEIKPKGEKKTGDAPPSITLVKIEFTPFVCGDCGHLQVMSDQVSGTRACNCNSCLGDNVSQAGPEQTMTVSLYPRAVPAFSRGEK